MPKTIFTIKDLKNKNKKDIFQTHPYPQAVGPYSPFYKAGKLLFCSGQIGLNPKTMKIVEGGIEKETYMVCENIKGVLYNNKLLLKNVVKTTIFLKNIEDFQNVNEIYKKYFGHKPARSTIEVSNLPLGALVEIEVIAKFDK